MAWRLHLMNQAIRYLDILPSERRLAAVWPRRDRVFFYDVESGVMMAEQYIQPPEDVTHDSDEWQTFIAELAAPNGVYLPVVYLSDQTVYLTADGRMRLYHGVGANLKLENEGSEVPLDVGEASQFVALSLDRSLGLSAALDSDARLHLFQQHIRVGAFDLGLELKEDRRAYIAITAGGGSVYVTDGKRIVRTDTSGDVLKQQDAYHEVRQMCCSPNGQYLVTNDLDTGVVRVYDGETLTPLYQRFAIDLVAEATQVQLMADLPPVSVAPSTLACDDDGTLAFSMSGIVCVSDVSYMDGLPRPQTLF